MSDPQVRDGDIPAQPAASGDALASDAPDVSQTGADRSVPMSVGEPVDPASSEPAPKVDYEALAAELEEYERRRLEPAPTTDEVRAAPDAAVAGSAAPVSESVLPIAEPDSVAEAGRTTEVVPAAAGQTTATRVMEDPATSGSLVPPSAGAQTTAAPASFPQRTDGPVYVQAPEPPRRKGNRGAAGLIGLLATVIFGGLLYGVTLLTKTLEATGSLDGTSITQNLAVPAQSLHLWITVVVFFLAFWLLGAVVNRAGWASWVLLGFFTALTTYAGYVFGVLVEQQFWTLPAEQVASIAFAAMLSPAAVLAFVFAREITIWFGGWVARRGAKVTVRNDEAETEYQRIIDQGPQLAL